MTNHWNDIANADVVMIAGANPASNHPVAFKHILEARRRGAKVITLDPRYTRSANRSDLYCRLRPGTDIAFVNGMIRHALKNGKYHEEYVRWATSASFLVKPDYAMTDGLFSGYDASKRAYDAATWAYQKDEAGLILTDPTLKDPRCVLRLLEAHVERYTPKVVAEVCGCDEKDFLAVADAFCGTGRPDRAGTLLYAMGLTQHTVGSQNVRVWAVLQTLLGNMGIAGGGINAMRGESNVQGSTDFGLLYHILPGYLQTPIAADRSLADYLKRCTPRSADPTSANWWQNTPKYVVSYLKAMYGPVAT
jgi:formate dehydrogenase major subunit